jgi:hypothetical protein
VIAILAALGAITFVMALRADHTPPGLPGQRLPGPGQHRHTPAIHEAAAEAKGNP